MSDMVPDEVEAPERPRRLLDNAPSLLVLRQIGCECERPTSSAGDFGHHRVDAGPVDVDDANRCALPRETERARAAHAGGCGSHDADLVLQAHVCGPPGSWFLRDPPCRAARALDWRLVHTPSRVCSLVGWPQLPKWPPWPDASLGCSLRSARRGCNRHAIGEGAWPFRAQRQPACVCLWYGRPQSEDSLGTVQFPCS